MSNFWIGVVSREHVLLGVKGGFMQLNHGKQAPLKKLSAGDGVVFYSPKTAYPEGEPLQSFTALGRIRTGEVYPFEMSKDFKPFRTDVQWLKAKEAPIRPLIEQLDFIKDKKHWGAAFRYGNLKVSAADFAVIAKAMGRDFDADFALS